MVSVEQGLVSGHDPFGRISKLPCFEPTGGVILPPQKPSHDGELACSHVLPLLSLSHLFL